MFRQWLQWMWTAALSACLATMVAQVAGVGVMWSRGVLTRDKITRYAAVVYGFDPRDFRSGDEPGQTAAPNSQTMSREAQIAQRASSNPVLADRLRAAQGENANAFDRVRELKTRRERHEFVEKSFEILLDQLEQDANTIALQEVQRTLETLQPKQAKELILNMLNDPRDDQQDDVLSDIVAVIKSMSQDKLKKILGEFKSDAERETLHEIMLQVGDIAARERWEPNS